MCTYSSHCSTKAHSVVNAGSIGKINLQRTRRGMYPTVSESGEWLFWCGVARGDAGSGAMIAELEGGHWQPARRRQTRSMTRRVRPEQSAWALCVDVLEIASSGNMLDEIVGSIEKGCCQAAERLERQERRVWAWMRIAEDIDQGSVTSVWWSNTICHLTHQRGEPVRLGGRGFGYSKDRLGLWNTEANWTDSIPAQQSSDWLGGFNQAGLCNGPAMRPANVSDATNQITCLIYINAAH